MEDVLLRSLLEHEGTIARVYRGFGVHGCIKFCILLFSQFLIPVYCLACFTLSLFVCLIDTFFCSAVYYIVQHGSSCSGHSFHKMRVSFVFWEDEW